MFAAGALLIPVWTFNFRPKRWRGDPILPADANQVLWHTLTAISMLYLLVGTFWFQHWYVLWVLAPAVLLPDRRFTRSMLPWLVFGALSSNVAMSFLQVTVLESAPPIVKYGSVVLIIWVPLLIAWITHMLAQRLGKRRFAIQSRQPYG